MKKLSISLFIAFSLIFLFTGKAEAYFEDNPSDTWYYESVNYAEQKDWINGFPDGLFHPNEFVSKSQLITIVSRALNYSPTNNNTYWYSGYLERGVIEGYVFDVSGMEEPITRYDTAKMIYFAFDLDDIERDINISTPFLDIDDEYVTTLYSFGVITGINGMDGAIFDGEGHLTRAQICAILMRLDKNDNIKKLDTADNPNSGYIVIKDDKPNTAEGEVVNPSSSPVPTQVPKPTASIEPSPPPVATPIPSPIPTPTPTSSPTPTPQPVERPEQSTSSEVIEPVQLSTKYFLSAPNTYDRSMSNLTSVIEAYKYLCLNNLTSIEFEVYGDNTLVNEKIELLKRVVNGMSVLYPEYFNTYMGGKVKFTKENPNSPWIGTLTLTEKTEISTESMFSKRDSLLYNSKLIVEKLFENGTLKTSMTDTEKAKAIATYILDNAYYDLTTSETSHFGADFFIDQSLVCDGYTAVYNTMLKYVGIECYGVEGIVRDVGHLWTMAKLDGNWRYIDMSFMDPIIYNNDERIHRIDYDYFNLTKEQLLKTGPQRTMNESYLGIIGVQK